MYNAITQECIILYVNYIALLFVDKIHLLCSLVTEISEHIPINAQRRTDYRNYPELVHVPHSLFTLH